jgi:hypothetical protein
VRRNAITASDLEAFERHLSKFYELRTVFVETGVRVSLSLPRQHSLIHYVSKIERFASPNGLCSSITESTHIRAVKEPWRRSSRSNPLRQMMKSISRGSKMTAIRRVFQNRGMLNGNLTDYALAERSGNVPVPQPYGDISISEDTLPDDDDDDDDEGPLPGKWASAQVLLAVKPGMCWLIFLSY